MPLTPKQLQKIEARLHEERERLGGQLEEFIGPEAAEDSQGQSGDTSKFPTHPADLGTDVAREELEASIATRRSAEIAEIGATLEDVLDYFRWRQSDAGRCAINAWVYWTMRAEGMPAAQATRESARRNFAWKNEWLFQRGINFDALPAWQKRGVGAYWESYAKVGVDPRTGAEVQAMRRRLARSVHKRSMTVHLRS